MSEEICPWVRGDTTKWCSLAENASSKVEGLQDQVATLKAEVARLERALDEAKGFAWRLNRYYDS